MDRLLRLRPMTSTICISRSLTATVRAYSLTDGHLVWTSTAIPSTEYANNAVPLVDGGIGLGRR